jgi:hypothetical protein
VVEFKNARICLTTVNARVCREVLGKARAQRIALGVARPRDLCSVDVSSFSKIRPKACAAPVLPAGTCAGERVRGQVVLAATTPPEHASMMRVEPDEQPAQAAAGARSR